MFLIFPDPLSIAEYVSAALIDKIKSDPRFVLGAATGGTMEPIYACFVEQSRAQGLDVSGLTSFNLDEYVGLPPDHPKSYAAYMRHHLFQHLNFDESRCHLPDGLAADLDSHCLEYSNSIRRHGGVGLQLLGVGSNGHIGFNEPGTAFDSRCHVVQLSERTRQDNSRFFENAMVPASAITMGMQDIMEAHEILLIATGEAIPFTLLKRHPRAKIILDEAAASQLSIMPERRVASGR